MKNIIPELADALIKQFAPMTQYFDTHTKEFQHQAFCTYVKEKLLPIIEPKPMSIEEEYDRPPQRKDHE